MATKIEVDEALAFLQTASSTSGSSVFDHLTEVVAKILEDRPSEALDLLETSYIVKKTSVQPVKPNISAASISEVASSTSLLMPEPEIDEDTGSPKEFPPANEYTCEDCIRDGHLFYDLGIGLLPKETLEVALMTRQLGEDVDYAVDSIHFFGKFFGLNKDYFVFETSLKDRPEPPVANDGGTPPEVHSGTNQWVYFVSSGPGETFTRLPDTRPDHIKAARSIKRFLTGDLDSDVSAFPLFPGQESHYLRAQIARITAATIVCPSGLYTVSEEGKVVKDDEPRRLEAGELKELSNWCHLTPHLKRQGRCYLYVRQPAEGEEEGFELTEEETEEGPDLLSPLDADLAQFWTVLCGSSAPSPQHQVVGLRSNLWPGAYTVCKNNNFANIYVGWGVKNSPCLPPLPPKICKEPVVPPQCRELPEVPIEDQHSDPEAQS